ncbi:hypothetical protein K7X08_007858 [Anisodus acutangulus]|uniref:Nucleotide-diphospho-sugar transferase domain-containing protein n=1 Tax=Anisodus acutangulus TaxID=402998 RepID=A0A9Q1RNL8_9SOLA|nr:hypothetical protein K7X08_007858 [Anisodus acutangulus]
MLTDLLPRCTTTTTTAITTTNTTSTGTGNSVLLVRRITTVALFVSFSCFVLYRAGESIGFRIPGSFTSRASFFLPADNVSATSVTDSEEYRLEKVLKNAAMEDTTVILTTLNEAWAAPNSVVDLFLESFRIGDHTRRLLNHLVIIALDEKAFSRCLALHTHCYALVTQGVDFSKEAYFMFPDYLKMMWRRIDFLRVVLEMGYNFVFTDADVMWFRDPFTHFYKDADFQIACDHFSGKPDDVGNRPNGGFNHVRSNNRSIEFYKYWYSSREKYPGLHDQDVLNNIKNDSFIRDIDLKMRFLDTSYFGGFCEPSKNLSKVCTMHANCCFGMESKLHDLRILLQDWKNFLSLPPAQKISSELSWRVPQNCSLDSLRHYAPPPMNIEQLNGHRGLVEIL